MASIASIAWQNSAFLTNALKISFNSEGMYVIEFFIRGKPWYVHVDDYMIVDATDNLQFA